MIEHWKIILWMIAGAVAASLLIVWAVFFNAPESPEQPPAEPLGQGSNLVPVSPSTDPNSEVLPAIGSSAASDIFKIHNGPVAGATLIQTNRPTTTVARFMLQTNGHTFDLPLDSPGAVPKAISNTTIPGIAKVQWASGGQRAIAQYLSGEAVKTTSFGFPIAGSATTTPVRVQFLPEGINSFALSPDGARVVYTLRGQSGAEGYIADATGSNARRTFLLPLSQVALSWPAQSTLMAISNPATGVGGIIFTINAQSGEVAPLLFADGLTATANPSLTHLVYQTAGARKTTYSYDTASGASRALLFDPLPEQCIWGRVLLYCPTPLNSTGADHIDLYHQGLISTPHGLMAYNPKSADFAIIDMPGVGGGTEEADIAEIALSPDESYLLYITKGDRSLWGVRLK